MSQRREEKKEVVIEYPSQGATYSRDEYGVYAYGVYPRSSVLAGQTSRQFLGSYPTFAEAKAAHPEATRFQDSSGYAPPYLGHLPDPEGSDPFGDNEDAYREGLEER